MSRNKLRNSARREWLHPKSVSYCEVMFAIFHCIYSCVGVNCFAFFFLLLFLANFPHSIPGIILRDSHGVAQVRFVSGNKILRIMKSVGLKPDLPEDLYYLIKKAVAIRKHLERSRKDKDSKFRLILVESRIHRLARFYKTKAVLPPTWKYESSTASALVA